ncbi:MAG: hypothetical protein ABI811_01355 [Acidobacteriota bacterium]
MHRLIQDHLEEVLSGAKIPDGHPLAIELEGHLKACQECREETAAMRAQSAVLREWNAAKEEVEPRPGFYARVLERIEAQRPVSIWALFTDSLFGRRLAVASLAVAMFMGAYVVSSEQGPNEQLSANAGVVEMDPLYPSAGFTDEVMSASAFRGGASNNDAVFVSLVTYQGR